MLKSYLKFAGRSMLKNKFYTAINVASLTAGFFLSILIFLYINDELSYDRFHEKADRIYRVTFKSSLSSTYNVHFARHPYRWVLRLEDEFPEIEQLVRFQQMRHAVAHKDKKFYEDRFYYTDPEVFQIFSYRFIKGNPATALKEPKSIVLTESMAQKYFGDEDPLGKIIGLIPKFQDSDKVHDYKITGLIEDVPTNSHFHFDFLAKYPIPKDSPTDTWNYVYVQLAKGISPADFREQIPDFIERNWPNYNPDFHDIVFQPIMNIHLFSKLDRELEKNSDINYVYILSVIAALILFVASINYINISTAKSIQRAKEIGIRKILGENKKSLIIYFLCESIFVSILAFCASIILVMLFLPLFNSLVDKSLEMDLLVHAEISLILLGSAVVIGAVVGLYPALVVSSSSSVKSIQTQGGGLGESRLLPGRLLTRKILVIFQFAVSIILIICMLSVKDQLHYMHNKDIGMKTDNIIALPYLPIHIKDRFDTFKTVLSGKTEVIEISAQMDLPSREILDAGQVFAEEKSIGEDRTILYFYPVLDNYIDFMELELIAGRTFSEGSHVEKKGEYILNEAAVKVLGWDKPEEALNKEFSVRDFPRGKVIGVLKDFNNSTLKQKIKPFVCFVRPIWNGCFLVKIRPENLSSSIAMLTEEWAILFPNYPFEYYFTDELYGRLYSEDESFASVISSFSIFAIIISCFGLFGLSSITTMKRTREIGIRKVLGSSSAGIVKLIFKEFLSWIVVANIIAWPVAYYVMNRWLEQFAFRTELSWTSYIIAGILALFITLLTLSYQTMKAASSNPVDTIRSSG